MKHQTTVYLWRSFLILALLTDLIPQISLTSSEISSWYNADRDKSFHRAMAWLRENSDKKDIVLTPWQFGAQIPAFTGRRSIASSKVYPSEARTVAERYADLKTFFHITESADEALDIADKYNAKFIFFQSRWRVKENSLLEQMNERKSIKNFTLAYDSGRYMIYRLDRENNEIAEDLINILARSNDIVKTDQTIFSPFKVNRGISLNFHGKIIFPGSGISKEDSIDLLFSKSEEQSAKIAQEHEINFIVLPKTPLPFRDDFKDVISEYSDNSGKSFNLKGRTTILGRMLNNRKMNYFELALSSDKYLLYKVKEPAVLRHFTRDFEKKKELMALFENENITIAESPAVYGCIVPHLLPSAKLRQLSAQLLNTIARNQAIDTIIILGPDHFDSGKGNISISLRDWVTPFGILETDQKIAGHFVEKGLAAIDEEAHEAEHSLIAFLPLIKYKFPETRIVPMLLKRKVSPAQAEALGIEISKILNSRTLIIVSCDLSHFYEPEEAFRLDTKSIETIRDFRKDELYESKIDCPSGIYALLTAMEQKGALKTKVLGRSDTGLNKNSKGVIGYCTIIFTKE